MNYLFCHFIVKGRFQMLCVSNCSLLNNWTIVIVHCCSVAQSCPTLCDPMNCSTPGFSVLHYLPEFAQTHVHWIYDAIQSPHPLSPPSPPALNLPKHHSFPVSRPFTSGGQSIGVSASASVLPVNIQDWSLLGLVTMRVIQFLHRQQSMWFVLPPVS